MEKKEIKWQDKCLIIFPQNRKIISYFGEIMRPAIWVMITLIWLLLNVTDIGFLWVEKIRHSFERKTQQLLCVTQEKTLATLLLSLAEIHNRERRVSLLFCELNNSAPVLRTVVFLFCQTTHLL